VLDLPASPAKEALKHTIAAKRAEDPLIGAKLGSREVVTWLLKSLTTERGVHAESALAAIGSLAGFACPASVAAKAINLKRTPQQLGVLVVETNDGSSYWFGDIINSPLVEGQLPIWNLIHGMARNLGATGPLPEVSEVLGHVAKSIGSHAFGAPRVTAEHTPGDTPFRFVMLGWPASAAIREFYCSSPDEWPLLYGLAAQQLMEQCKAVLAPDLAATIILECAAPMAKLNPTRLFVMRE
jgi:hypothetical protein